MSNYKTVKSFSFLEKKSDNNLQNRHDNIAKLAKPEWIINNWLPKGYVTALFGNNAKEKLLFLQQLATNLTLGTKFLDNKLKPLNVLFLTPSYKSNKIIRQQLNINDYYNVNMTNTTEFIYYYKSKELFTIFGKDNIIYHTEYLNHLVDFISACQPDLVIIDNFQNFYSGGLDKNSEILYLIDSTLNYIAKVGECAVLVSNTTVDCAASEFGELYNAFNLCWHLTQPDSIDTSQRFLIRSTLNKTHNHDEYKALQLDNGFFAKSSLSLGASENDS